MNTTEKKHSHLKYFLLISLALNLFFVGIFGAKFMHLREQQMTPPEQLYAAVELLEPKYQDEVRAILDEQIPKVEDNFQEMFLVFQSMRSLMIEADFDPMKMMEFRQKVMDARQMMMATFSQTMMRISMELPADQRKIFFEAALPEAPPMLPPSMIEKIKENSEKMDLKR